MGKACRLPRVLAAPIRTLAKLSSRVVHTLEVRKIAVKKVISLTSCKGLSLPSNSVFKETVLHFSASFSLQSLKRWFTTYQATGTCCDPQTNKY